MIKTYTKNEAIKWPIPNYWDAVAFCLVFSALILLIFVAQQMTIPYQLGQEIPISLDPHNLPGYALRTIIRMFIGLFFALIFTFTFGTWAAKNKKAERIIVPMIDILQSVPVLSFLSITVTGFISIFKGSMLGPECAAIFAIFCAQAWNMTLSFYQSVRTVPSELKEAAQIFHLSTWQRFWRVDVSFAMPGLLWNMMMSMSGSWFFVTASEAFSVANQKIKLPGVGSYIALAISAADTRAIMYAILTMLIVILLYDQFLFRPLSRWVYKFKFESVEDEDVPDAWVTTLFRQTVFIKKIGDLFDKFTDKLINIRFTKYVSDAEPSTKITPTIQRLFSTLYKIVLLLFLLGAVYLVSSFFISNVSLSQLGTLLYYGCCTGLRVIVLITISSLIWVPVGVWIGFRPRVSAFIQPIVQFLAAFPANLAFPIVAFLIIKYNLNVEVWTSPLMVLGTQWYILFNVIAGANALPKELKQATATFKVKGFLRWRTFILPGIFPFYLTGAITAAGGAWNASIIAEVVHWGAINLHATGLGAYITDAAEAGNFTQVILGTIVMCLFVLTINRLVWRPLYNLAAEKFTLR